MNSSFAYVIPGMEDRKSMLPAKIKSVVKEHYQLTEKEFASKTRYRRICEARGMFYKIMRNRTNWTLKEMASYLGISYRQITMITRNGMKLSKLGRRVGRRWRFDSEVVKQYFSNVRLK